MTKHKPCKHCHEMFDAKKVNAKLLWADYCPKCTKRRVWFRQDFSNYKENV
jgi:hypothetical protein